MARSIVAAHGASENRDAKPCVDRRPERGRDTCARCAATDAIDMTAVRRISLSLIERQVEQRAEQLAEELAQQRLEALKAEHSIA
jgi:hypothetical protein